MNDDRPLTLPEVADGVKRVTVQRGNARYELNLDLVEQLAANGLKPDEIASFFGMTLVELKKKREVSKRLDAAIETGKAKGIARIANKLFNNALNDNIIAQIFYLKTVGKWREADKLPQEDESRDRVVVHLPHNARD